MLISKYKNMLYHLNITVVKNPFILNVEHISRLGKFKNGPIKIIFNRSIDCRRIIFMCKGKKYNGAVFSFDHVKKASV